jgi:hypothetical protein
MQTESLRRASHAKSGGILRSNQRGKRSSRTRRSKSNAQKRCLYFLIGKAGLTRSVKGEKRRKVLTNPRLKLLSCGYFGDDQNDPEVRAIVRLYPDSTTRHEDFLLGFSRELDCFVPHQRPGESLPGQPYPALSAPAKWQTSLVGRTSLTSSGKTKLLEFLQENFPRYEHLVASMQFREGRLGMVDLRRYVLGHWWDGSTFVRLSSPFEVFPTGHEVHGEDDFPSWYRQITSIE